MVSRKLASCFGLALFLTAGAVASQQTESPETSKQEPLEVADLELSLEIASQFATFRLETIREEVEVRTNTKKSHFYTVPLLMPRWPEFAESLTEAGVQRDDQSVHTVALFVDLSSKATEDELIRRINAELKRGDAGAKEINDGLLSVFPHVFFQLYAKLGNRTAPIYTSVDLANLATSGARLLSTTRVARRVGTAVTGTGSELWGFYDNRGQNDTVTGQLYSKGYAVLSNVVSVRAQTLLDAGVERRLFGEETFTATNEVTSGSSGGGFSLNLGVIGFGGGGGSSIQRSKSSSQRFVSRDYVASLLREGLARVNIGVLGDSATADELLKAAMDFVLAASQSATLEFRKSASDNWQLGNDVLGYADLGKQEVREVLSSAPSIDTSASSETEGEYSGAKGSSSRETKFTYKDSIKWERDGTGWVPSTVDISIVDRASLRDAIELDISKNIRASNSDQYTYQFVTPVAGIYEEDLARESLTERLVEAEKADEELNRLLEATNNRIRIGYSTIGNSSHRVKKVTIKFSSPLPRAPRVVGNLRSSVANFNDNFEFTVWNVKPDRFDLSVRRNDGPANWGQALYFEWIAILDKP